MRRVLSGARYDTSTAIFIGSHTYGEYPQSSSSWRATLCKAPRAYRFFLYGSGGQMTRFADSFYREAPRVEKIIPLESYEAYLFASEYLDDETIDRYFYTFKHGFQK